MDEEISMCILEQKLLTLPVHVARYFCVMYCRLLFVVLSFLLVIVFPILFTFPASDYLFCSGMWIHLIAILKTM
jgi:hypothetical protein